MASGVFNRSKGRVNEYIWRVNNADPANSGIVVALLQAVEDKEALKEHADFAVLLGAVGNTECNFTNYARKALGAADFVDPTTDSANDRQESAMPDQVWVNAGGATNNTVLMIVTGYDVDTTSGTDSGIAPMTYHDFVYTTKGVTLTAQSAVNDIFFRAG